MHDATIVVLMAPEKVIPLSWVQWKPGARVVCRLLTPEDAACRQHLLRLLARCQPYPCMLKDPVGQHWVHFDAYLTEWRGAPEVEVTLTPTGPLWVSAAAPPPPRPRQRRCDAGMKRGPRKVARPSTTVAACAQDTSL